MKLGKKFIFATVAIICVSIVTVLLEYAGDIYFKLVAGIVGIFTISQSYVDSKGGANEKSV